MTLVNAALKQLVQKAYEKGKIKEGGIPNSSIFVESEVPLLRKVATLLGIDFEATKYSYTYTGTYLNSPEVIQDDGVPALKWGEVIKPLSDFFNNKRLSVTLKVYDNKDSKRLCLMVADRDDDEFPAIEFPIASGKLTNERPLSNAFDKMKEGDKEATIKFASLLYMKPEKLASLPDGTYKVTGTSKSAHGYVIRVNGRSYFGNAAVSKILNHSSENSCTPENPGVLEIFEHYTCVVDGKEYYAVKCDFTTGEQLEKLNDEVESMSAVTKVARPTSGLEQDAGNIEDTPL